MTQHINPVIIALNQCYYFLHKPLTISFSTGIPKTADRLPHPPNHPRAYVTELHFRSGPTSPLYNLHIHSISSSSFTRAIKLALHSLTLVFKYADTEPYDAHHISPSLAMRTCVERALDSRTREEISRVAEGGRERENRPGGCHHHHGGRRLYSRVEIGSRRFVKLPSIMR